MDSPDRDALVVDDTPGPRELIAELLASEGYTVTTAHDGLEGLAWITRRLFNLIVTDIEMPGADGLAVLRSARARQPAARLVAVSGNEAMRDAALAEGASTLVHKGPEFVKSLRQALRQPQASTEHTPPT